MFIILWFYRFIEKYYVIKEKQRVGNKPLYFYLAFGDRIMMKV